MALGGNLDPVSNQETWELDLEFLDDVTGDPYFLQASPPDEITITVRDKDQIETELGSLTGGEIVVTGDGEARLTVAYADTGAFCAGNYDIGCLYTDAGIRKQLFLGRIAVEEGL